MASDYQYNKNWRINNPRARQNQKSRYYGKHRYPGRSGAIWSIHEEKAILAPKRPSDVVLAKQLGRSVEAIQIHRSRLKKKIKAKGASG